MIIFNQETPNLTIWCFLVVSLQRSHKQRIVRLDLPPYDFPGFRRFASAKPQKTNRKVGFAFSHYPGFRCFALAKPQTHVYVGVSARLTACVVVEGRGWNKKNARLFLTPPLFGRLEFGPSMLARHTWCSGALPAPLRATHL